MGDNLELREWGMFMILVARALERIGDNTVDIAEQVVFVVTGLFREMAAASSAGDGAGELSRIGAGEPIPPEAGERIAPAERIGAPLLPKRNTVGGARVYGRRHGNAPGLCSTDGRLGGLSPACDRRLGSTGRAAGGRRRRG